MENRIVIKRELFDRVMHNNPCHDRTDDHVWALLTKVLASEKGLDEIISEVCNLSFYTDDI